MLPALAARTTKQIASKHALKPTLRRSRLSHVDSLQYAISPPILLYSSFSSLEVVLVSFSGRSFSTSRPSDGAGSGSGGKGLSTATAASSKDENASSASSSSSGSNPSPDLVAAASSSSKSSTTSISTKKETSITKKATDASKKALQSLLTMLSKVPGVTWFYITHPKDLRKKLAELKVAAVNEANHYWMGSKLLAADIRTARHIMGRTFHGSTLSRRERKQLLRTVTDVFRLVPMSVFVLIPFMEIALPFALKMFPNMLPSTFQDSLKEEEKMKGELQMRISMAGFFQDTLAGLAKEQKKFAQIRKHNADKASDAESIEIKKEETAISFLDFLKQARTGEAIPPDVIIKFAKYFEDDLTLDNMSRMQLVNMCKYMGIPPYGNDNLLRFQLRHRIRLLKDDDQRILWEGISSLTKMELREACRERGMRSTGLSKDAYRKALQQWLELSVNKNVPISLLIMSRTFFLHNEMVSGESKTDDESSGVSGLADAMSGIDKEVVNEIVLEMASSEEKSKNADVMKIQLEVLEQQNEMIKEEQEERDALAKEKEEKERIKEEQEERDAAAKEKEEKEGTDEKEINRMNEISKNLEDEALKAVSDNLVDTTAPDVATSGGKKKTSAKDIEEVEEEEQTELSTEEIDAISQLASPDPVHREREELKRIKDKMQEKSETDIDEGGEYADASSELYSDITPSEPFLTKDAAEESVEIVKELENEAKDAADTVMQGGDEEHDEDEEIVDKKLQKAIDRLKYRVESMVGKIETQLSDVEVKIGNKFHLLDKDMDGVLTMEEMTQVLQTVLKRDLTAEEAVAIAMDMDANKDGVFSIAELAEWAETNTIAKLAADGREKDLDAIITERVAVVQGKKKDKGKNSGVPSN